MVHQRCTRDHLNPKKGIKIPENHGVGIKMGEDQKEENQIIGDAEEEPADQTKRDFEYKITTKKFVRRRFPSQAKCASVDFYQKRFYTE